MKKIISVLICFLLLLCCGCSQNVSAPDKTENEQKQPVYLPVEIVKEDDGMLEGIAIYRTNYEYNEYGECTLRKGEYDNDAGPGFSEKNTYDENGRLIKTETVSEAGMSTIVYEYDEKNNLTRKIGATEGANVGGITTYTYNEKSQRISAEFCSYFGTDTEQYAQQQPYNIETTEFFYNQNGLCDKITSSYGEEYVYTYTVQYNENSMPEKIIADDSQDTVNETLFEYDKQGRCIKITTDFDSTVYNYENGSLPTSAVYTREGGKPCNVTYKYKPFYLRGEKQAFDFHIKEHMDFLEW